MVLTIPSDGHIGAHYRFYLAYHVCVEVEWRLPAYSPEPQALIKQEFNAATVVVFEF